MYFWMVERSVYSEALNLLCVAKQLLEVWEMAVPVYVEETVFLLLSRQCLLTGTSRCWSVRFRLTSPTPFTNLSLTRAVRRINCWKYKRRQESLLWMWRRWILVKRWSWWSCTIRYKISGTSIGSTRLLYYCKFCLNILQSTTHLIISGASSYLHCLWAFKKLFLCQLLITQDDLWLDNPGQLKIPVKIKATEITVKKQKNELFISLTHHLFIILNSSCVFQ